ncbi:MAG: cytochrome c3 family protein, partial [Oceanisphaera sp.]|nr:cytochrome c3 family protein [Oceanisphaera sp.]
MRTILMLTCIAGLCWLAMGDAAAQQGIPEVIDFPGAGGGTGTGGVFQSIYSGPVKFTHLKHAQDYGASCGDCHHDENVEPIETYDSDAEYTCGACHPEEGLLRGPTAENSSTREDRLEYRANAIHMQC